MKRLRIFYASQLGCSGLPNSRLWRANLFLPLVELGHDVIEFDYDLEPHFAHLDPSYRRQRAFIEEHRPRLEAALLEQVRRAHRERPIDLFFSYFYSACVRPETIREIRALGIPTMNWYCNGSFQMHLVAEIAPAYDWCLVPEIYRLDDYRAIGANPIYCQEAANPSVYRPYDVPVEFDVTFVGQCYGDRGMILRRLYDRGIDVRAWGPGWLRERKAEPVAASAVPVVASAVPGGRSIQSASNRSSDPTEGGRYVAVTNVAQPPSAVYLEPADTLPEHLLGPALSDDELIRMYSRSKISLGFSKCGGTHKDPTPILQIRLRDFEAPMSGAFYMVEYMRELEQFYAIGREIVCYHDADDLADKAEFYLTHDAERERIRRAGQARCLRDHTWQKRFETVFSQTGLT